MNVPPTPPAARTNAGQLIRSAWLVHALGLLTWALPTTQLAACSIIPFKQSTHPERPQELLVEGRCTGRDARQTAAAVTVCAGSPFLGGLKLAQRSALLAPPSPTCCGATAKRGGQPPPGCLSAIEARRCPIKKATGTTKYYPTDKGLLVMGAAISIKDKHIPRLMEEIKHLAS